MPALISIADDAISLIIGRALRCTRSNPAPVLHGMGGSPALTTVTIILEIT